MGVVLFIKFKEKREREIVRETKVIHWVVMEIRENVIIIVVVC